MSDFWNINWISSFFDLPSRPSKARLKTFLIFLRSNWEYWHVRLWGQKLCTLLFLKQIQFIFCCWCFFVVAVFLISDNLCLLISIGLLNLHYVRSAKFSEKFWDIFQNINPCNQRPDKITRHLLQGRAHTRKLLFWSASFLSWVL